MKQSIRQRLENKIYLLEKENEILCTRVEKLEYIVQELLIEKGIEIQDDLDDCFE